MRRSACIGPTIPCAWNKTCNRRSFRTGVISLTRRPSRTPWRNSDSRCRSSSAPPRSGLRSGARSSDRILKTKEFVVKKEFLAVILGALMAGSTAWAQAATAAAPTPAPATGMVPTKIGIIEIQNALVSTKDGQKAMVEFQTKLEPRKKELERKAADI